MAKRQAKIVTYQMLKPGSVTGAVTGQHYRFTRKEVQTQDSEGSPLGAGVFIEAPEGEFTALPAEDFRVVRGKTANVQGQSRKPRKARGGKSAPDDGAGDGAGDGSSGTGGDTGGSDT